MVTVKGIKVNSEEVVIDVCIDFCNLTEEGQRRLLLENKDDFTVDALKSQYPSVVELFFEVCNECSSEALRVAILECVKEHIHENRILELLNVPGLELDESALFVLAFSEKLHIIDWGANYKKTPLEILMSEPLFFDAVVLANSSLGDDRLESIINNPNFKPDDKMVEAEMRKFSMPAESLVRRKIKELRQE